MIGSMQAAAPLLVLAVTVAVAMTVIAIRRDHTLASSVCGLGIAIALACVPWAVQAQGGTTGSLFVFDPLSLGLAAVILLASLAVLGLGYGYWTPTHAIPREEYPLLLLIATLGAVAMAASTSFLTLFLGLETMTLGMIGMIAYPRFRPEAEEAGLKYLVLSGISSAFVLFGIGLIELSTGSLNFIPDLGRLDAGTIDRQMVLAGLAMIAVGAGFKLSVVPFHIWVPDIYAGAPAPSGAYIAVISKIAVLAVIMRVLAFPLVSLSSGVVGAITLVAILSMVIGNLLALLQENLKRILGYSSIAHFGYLLVALLAADAIGRAALVFYLVMYAITVIAAFGVLSVLSGGDQPRDLDQVDDLRGLFWTRPVVAAIMTLALLSLAGIPPAIGFIAKMYILAAAVHTELWLLTSVMVVGSVIGLFYYLRIIIVMSLKPDGAPSTRRALPLPGGVAIICLTIPLVVFGIAPQPLISLLKSVLG
jgi:NADH-quinone oxidoreductase subunit N